MIVNSPELAPFDLLPALLRGLATTVELTVAGAALALVVALIAGVARSSSNIIIRTITGFYVEVFRGSSILVQMFWIFFVLPLPPFNIELSALQAGILALGLNVGAYGAEVVRGAIRAIPRGQIEAATALNMPRGLMMRRVIIPQAMVRILPPFGNLLIELLKATSLASLITLSDVTFQALSLRQTVGRTTEVFGLVLIIYFLLAYPLTLGVRWLERQRRWA
jgi:polar amino acid transport system permease protein